MYLKELKLTNFKNYETGVFRFSPRLNLLLGLNGMGKTNVLDAVYYLCMGKSHFSNNERNVVKHGEAFLRLEGNFVLGKKKEKIVVKVVPGKEKVIERNGTPYTRIADHVGLLPVVFLVPDDTVLVLEGSDERRRFIDNTLCQLDKSYLNHLMVYNRILQNRNAALKQFAERNTFNPTLISTYNRQLLEPAQYIFEKRKWFIQVFLPLFNQLYHVICGETESVDCQYRSQLEEEDFSTLLESSLDRDKALQRTNTGIHKDDLLFFLDGLPLKRFASQGQLKSFVLALKLAQYECLRQEKGISPLLLLDDLFDKLDDLRVAQLIELLVKQNFGQVFITDTHPERAEDMAKKFANEYAKFVITAGAMVHS